MADVIAGLFVIALVVGLGWVVPIVYGVRSAKRKGYSPHWMWLGIYPLAGWIAFLVLACLSPRARCSSCGGFIGSHFKICPYCLHDVVLHRTASEPASRSPEKFADVTPDLAPPKSTPGPAVKVVGFLSILALILVACITMVTTLGTSVSGTSSRVDTLPGPAPARPELGPTAYSAGGHTPPLNTRVVPKFSIPLTVGNQVVDDNSLHRIYTVERVNGPWLWIASGSVSGWVQSDQVVPFDQAISYFTGVIRDNPGDANAYYNRALIWHDKGEFDIAIDDLNEAIRLDPESASAYNLRGIAWSAKGEHARAITDFDESIRLDPKLALAYCNRGGDWYSLHEYDKAIADCTDAIKLDPKLALAYCNRGAVWGDKGEYDKAFADYAEAIRLDPNLTLTYSNRGADWIAKGEYDKALADFTEAIRLDPKLTSAYYNRGLAWREKREYSRALADFTEAIRLDPVFVSAYVDRAWLWATCPDARFRDGQRSFTDATRACELTDWKDSQSFGTLAAAYAACGDFSHAVEYQEKALGLLPEGDADRADFSDRLALYREKKPYREEPEAK